MILQIFGTIWVVINIADANAIAERMRITPSAARQDLSRSYAILVPDPPAGADLRTLAVLRYLRETRQ